jgi:2',3'-cyclic-nucleotide 2'-phosphodiesterase (5'-nucleotidase family)
MRRSARTHSALDGHRAKWSQDRHFRDDHTWLPVTQSAPVVIRDDVAAIAYKTASSLRLQEGVDVVIFLSHLGKLYDQAIAANVPGIDIIVGGHDHSAFKQPIFITNLIDGKQTPIVQAGEFYEYVGKVTLLVNIPDTDSGAATVTLKDYQLIPWVHRSQWMHRSSHLKCKRLSIF